MALSLDEKGNTYYLNICVKKDIKRASVQKFAQVTFVNRSTIRSNECRSYIPALKSYVHVYKTYDLQSDLLQWMHIMVSNAKAFILRTYHDPPETYLRHTWTSLLLFLSVFLW